jgi:hypothetical protein
MELERCHTRAVRVRVPAGRVQLPAPEHADRVAGASGRLADACVWSVVYGLCWSSNSVWLARAERDDAPDRIVGRNPYGHPIAGHYLDPKSTHATAELRQHFVSGITLHTVESPAVHGHNSALHVYQVVLAQLLANPFLQDKYCATRVPRESSHLVIWSSGH